MRLVRAAVLRPCGRSFGWASVLSLGVAMPAPGGPLRAKSATRHVPGSGGRFSLRAQHHHGGLAFEIDEGFAAHVDCDRLIVPPVNRCGGAPRIVVGDRLSAVASDSEPFLADQGQLHFVSEAR
jgi:hypothetical protein